MATNISALTPSALKNLKDGPTVCIKWKKTPTSEPEIIRTFFPRAVAKAFSSSWSTLFPPVNKTTGGDMHKAHPTTLTIVGGSLAAHTTVLNWTLSCCNGNGVQQMQHILNNDKPFFRYFFLKESATLIGCTYLEKMLGERMNAWASKQIHSEDVRALWKSLPADHEMRQFLARHVATLTWNKELKAARAYYTLREELSDFGEAINAILNPLVEERRQKQKADRSEVYQNQREERKAAFVKTQSDRKSSGKHHDGEKKIVGENNATRYSAQVDDTAEPGKKVVPGAEDFSSIPYFTNKNAKRRHKRKEAKNADDNGTAGSV